MVEVFCPEDSCFGAKSEYLDVAAILITREARKGAVVGTGVALATSEEGTEGRVRKGVGGMDFKRERI